MIFLDTSAIYALADRADPNHTVAKERFSSILATGDPLLTHNYVLAESCALLQHRLGLSTAVAFAGSARSFSIEWIGEEVHAAAVRRWSTGKRTVSFVDHVSFVVMERRRVSAAFAFDADFEEAGFRIYPH
jgi:predicted nucleic acid-binding protein